jgi:hypothetical protein
MEGESCGLDLEADSFPCLVLCSLRSDMRVYVDTRGRGPISDLLVS